MERAEIEDLTNSWALLALQGPLARCAVGAVLGEEAARLPLWGVVESTFHGEPFYAARVPECGEDGFVLFVPVALGAALWGSLCQLRQHFAVHSVGWEALNLRRVEAGIPWWGAELDASLVPLEARLDHAVSMRKGCYVGQEIIARIDARGHVNNLMAGFFVDGDPAAPLPEPGSEIRHNGKKVGKTATAVHSPRLARPIALGFLRRELHEVGTRVEAVTPQGPVDLEVTRLPFVPNDYPADSAATGSDGA